MAKEEKKEAALRYLDWAMKSTEFKEHTPFAFWGALHGEGLSKLKFKDIPPPLQQAFVDKMIEAGGAKTEEEARDKLARSDWLAWHIDKDGKILVVGYQIHDEKPVFFWGPYGPNRDFSDPVKNALGVVPGKKVDRGFADWFCNSWIELGNPVEICTLNFSGNNIRIRQYMDRIEITSTQTYFEFAVSSDFFGCQKIGKAGFIDRYKGSSYEQEDLALGIGPGSCVVILGNENDGFLHGAFYVYGRNGEKTMFKRFRWDMSDGAFKAIFGETWAEIIKPSIGD